MRTPRRARPDQQGQPELRTPFKVCMTLGCGRRVSPKAYLSALKLALAHPDDDFDRSFNMNWAGPYKGWQLVREWRQMLADKWASQYPPTGTGNRAQRRRGCRVHRKPRILARQGDVLLLAYPRY